MKQTGSVKTYFSNVRFPSRPIALLALAVGVGFGLGATVGGSAATDTVGSSVFLLSAGATSVGGAEINALI